MSYPTKKLGEIVEVIMGQSPPSSSYNERGEGLPFFQGKAEFGEIYPTPVKYCSSPSRIAEENDILISVRAPVGNINIAREKSCVGRGLGALRAKKDILNQMFLFYFMKKSENSWSRLSTGSTFSAIKGSSLKNFEIPLPPLTAQKQIVERLDKIAEAQKLNDELIQKSAELFQSLLHKELNPAGKNWEVKKLSEVLEINYGKGLDKSKRVDSGKFFAYGSNGPVYRANESLIDNEVIVIGRKGTAGALYFVSEPCWPIDTTFFARPKSDASLKFIYYLLQTKNLPRLAIVTGVPGINRTTLSNINIQLPPLKVQKQIVAKLSAVQDYKKQLLDQKSKLKELFNSALARSMNSGQAKSFNG